MVFLVSSSGSYHIKWFKNKTLRSQGQFSELQVQRLCKYQQSDQGGFQVTNAGIFSCTHNCVNLVQPEKTNERKYKQRKQRNQRNSCVIKIKEKE